MVRSFITHMLRHLMRRGRHERGAAMVETAITLPLVLLVSVAIFEFGHAFQTWQILTNAAREGARVAVIQGSTNATVISRVQEYLTAGLVASPGSAGVSINRSVTISGTAGLATSVTVTYPFQFIVLQPVVQLMFPSATLGQAISMQALATMRNEV